MSPAPSNFSSTTGIARRSGIQKLALMAGFGGLLFTLTFLTLGAVAQNYDPFHDTISALEFTTVALAQRINFLLFGVLIGIFAAALRNELRHSRGALFIPLFQLFSAVGVVGDAIFIHPPLHLVCDLIAFISALFVLFGFAWSVRGDIYWKNWSAYSIAAAILFMGFLTAFGFLNRIGGPAGAMEKVAVVARNLWSALLSAKLLAGARLNIAGSAARSVAGARRHCV